MLIISCDMDRPCVTWWSKDYHERSLVICGHELGKVFRIPRSVYTITVALHTTPAKERVRVRVRLVVGDFGGLAVRTNEPGVYLAGLAVPDWIKRAIRKYKGKSLYLEVTY